MTNEVLTRLKRRHGNKMGLYLWEKCRFIFAVFHKRIFRLVDEQVVSGVPKKELEAGYFCYFEVEVSLCVY